MGRSVVSRGRGMVGGRVVSGCVVGRRRSMMVVSVGRDAGHVRNVGSAAEQQVRSARHVMAAVFAVTLGGVLSLSGSDGQQQHGSDSNDALHVSFLRLTKPPPPNFIIMNTIVAAVILSIVVVGAMGDYAAPAKYEAPAKAYHAPAPAYHAPAHHAPAPAYHAPAPHHGGYAHHSAPVVHAYAAKAPHVKCGANLLVGCAPNVAHVPCVPAHGGHGGYAAPAHAPAMHHGYAAPAHGYRSFSEADQASAAFDFEE
uniref:VM domain-containing protein n=3 Tax=gambiae species complex TaxID=44542 RepID=A0A182VAJ3_ANOME